MKEVLCIKKPGFFLKGGERYGPAYNEVCGVLEMIVWDLYPNERYYKLKGYDEPNNNFVLGFRMFRSVYFVDLISDEQLKEELEGMFVPWPLFKRYFYDKVAPWPKFKPFHHKV